MPQTIRQHRQLQQVTSAPRRDLRILTGAASYEAHQHYTDESLRWEMERAARTELLPVQPEPVLFCAPVEDEHLAGDIHFVTIGLLAIALLLIVGLLLREPVAHLLIALGVL